MNQRIETAPDTTPNASTAHDAQIRDIAMRCMSIGREIAVSVELHHGDQGARLGELLDELNLEHMRLSSAREVAYELASEQEAAQ